MLINVVYLHRERSVSAYANFVFISKQFFAKTCGNTGVARKRDSAQRTNPCKFDTCDNGEVARPVKPLEQENFRSCARHKLGI